MTEPYKPKLIEVALPLAEISDASSRDKSIKHGHPDNLHQWWARRPLPSARAVLFASLVDDPSSDPVRFPTETDQERERQRLFSILRAILAWDSSDDWPALRRARDEISRCYDGAPPVILDPFGGGGSIPLEAQRLGLQTQSGDLNPVSVLIQKAMIEVPPLFAGCTAVNPESTKSRTTWSSNQGLVADVRFYGELLVDTVQERLVDLYPTPHDGATELRQLAWIWARTVESPDPAWSGHVPLVSTWVVRKKPKKPLIWIEPVVDVANKEIHYKIREGGEPPERTVSGGRGTCVATGATISADYIKEQALAGRMGLVMLAVVAESDSGRVYLEPCSAQRDAANVPQTSESIPGHLSTHPQYMGTPRYGLVSWESIYSPRQLRALTGLSECLPEIRDRVRKDALDAGMSDDDTSLSCGGSGATAYAEAIVTYLAFVHDKVADLNCSLTAWKKDAECPVHLFGRQAIPMVWDFAEAYPFGDSSGSFRSSLRSVAAALDGKGMRIEDPIPGQVAQRDAAARISEAAPCVVCTDPPYYAQVPYADISDFFYVWIRRNLSSIWPDLCATIATPKSEELVADEKRHGGRQAAADFFEAGMREVMSALCTAQVPSTPATIFYAFRQIEDGDEGKASTGWETFLQALLDAGLAVTATWPIRTENKSRLRAMGSNALASSIVLACRRRPTDAALESRGGFIAALQEELPVSLHLLQQENIAPVDLAQSAIGPGMRIFSRYSKVVEADGSTMSVRTALALINEALGEALSAEEAELDADTRFALTWFDQYAHGHGSFGDADVLARAKDTSVDGVVKSGIAAARDGEVRLLLRTELAEDWSPLTDRRATVWEATQHLIGKLGRSESEAAQLLATLGGVGERSRQLAYLLFGICERKGLSDEATAYNSLITAWPELLRLGAGPSATPGSAQESLM